MLMGNVFTAHFQFLSHNRIDTLINVNAMLQTHHCYTRPDIGLDCLDNRFGIGIRNAK
jgi:hypothetical protein